MAATAEFAPELPDHIIHRILTFLSPIDAVKTTLVSKSWFRAWSTRPTIDLDESHFSKDHSSHSPTIDSSFPEIDRLAIFASKTFRRYKDQNLRIDTFNLCLDSEWYCLYGLATEWTNNALKLGATDFTFRIKHPSIVIPMHVVLGSKNVVRRLCLEQALIGRPKVIRCMGLKSLVLSEMELSPDSLFDMISCCPSIENLSLSSVQRPQEAKFHYDYEQAAARAASMTTLLNLTSLTLVHISSKVLALFLDNLSSKFPNLKDLTLKLSQPKWPSFRASDRDNILVISSGSMEILNLWLDCKYGAELEIDAPKIRKFTFDCSSMPKFSFRSKSSDLLESNLSLDRYGKLSSTWFYLLSQLLKSLAGSKIRLCLRLKSVRRFDFVPGDIERFNVSEVEGLTMDTSGLPTKSLYAFMDILFRVCHPKTITQYVSPPKEYMRSRDHKDLSTRKNNDEMLCRILEPIVAGVLGKGLSRFKSGLSDLRELNLAQDMCNEVWKAQQFDSLVLDSVTSVDQQRRFRFQLNWKPS